MAKRKGLTFYVLGCKNCNSTSQLEMAVCEKGLAIMCLGCGLPVAQIGKDELPEFVERRMALGCTACKDGEGCHGHGAEATAPPAERPEVMPIEDEVLFKQSMDGGAKV